MSEWEYYKPWLTYMYRLCHNVFSVFIMFTIQWGSSTNKHTNKENNYILCHESVWSGLMQKTGWKQTEHSRYNGSKMKPRDNPVRFVEKYLTLAAYGHFFLADAHATSQGDITLSKQCTVSFRFKFRPKNHTVIFSEQKLWKLWEGNISQKKTCKRVFHHSAKMLLGKENGRVKLQFTFLYRSGSSWICLYGPDQDIYEI